MAEAKESHWKKYFDEKYQSYYWYNEATQESKWVEEDSAVNSEQHQHEVEEKKLEDDQHFDEEDVEVNDQSDELLPGNSTELRELLSQSADGDIRCYARLHWLNAVLLEAPLAACEAIVRSVLCIVIAIVLMMIGIVFQSIFILSIGYSFIQEAIICIAASLTCCIPFAAPCLIYRRYDAFDSNWKIKPLWTIVGNVDARRFISFSFGGGWSASNAIAKKNRCQDSFGHKNVLFFPRSLLKILHETQLSSYHSRFDIESDQQ